jgi:outer membrane protein assembly factor BamE (lipoprotein component of BamABCDE complex)
MINMKFLFSTLSILLFCAACTPKELTRGNYLFPEDVASIQAGASTKRDVLNIFGTPSAKAVFDENIWYYIGLKTEKTSFFDEDVTGRQTVQVTFDENDRVVAIENLDTQAVDVPKSRRVTPTSGNEVTILQQMLGNIGKFNAPDAGNPAQ